MGPPQNEHTLTPDPKPARRKMPSWLPQVLGYAMAAGCLAWALHSYNIRDLLPQLRQLEWKWLALGMGLDVSVYVCQAWRWQVLYRPVGRLPFWTTVQAIFVGLFANEVLPLRVGELIRGYLVAHWNEELPSVVFASIAVERLVDGVWMILSFVLAAEHLSGIPRWLTITMRAIEVGVLAGIAVLVYLMLHKTHAQAMVKEGRWAAMLRHVLEGLHTMGNWRTMVQVMAISFLYLFLQVLSYWALIKGFELDLSVWDAAAVLAIIRLGIVIPNAPGNIGVINWACRVALHDVMGVEVNDAVNFSFVLLAALTLPLLIGGAIATALTGLNLGEIHHHARTGMHTERRPPADIT